MDLLYAPTLLIFGNFVIIMVLIVCDDDDLMMIYCFVLLCILQLYCIPIYILLCIAVYKYQKISVFMDCTKCQWRIFLISSGAYGISGAYSHMRHA
jgi:hypothetical protein